MQQVGSLFVELKANTSDFERGMKDARGEMQSFGKYADGISSSISKAGAKLEDFGKSMVKVGAPIGLAMAAGAKAAMDFENALTDVATRGKITGKALDSLRADMLKVGSDFKIGATAATEGLLDLVAGGMSVEEALATLPTVIAVSKAELVDMGNAADWLTDTMAQFGLNASQAGKAADTIARAAGASSATITDMFEALANVGPIARLFGISLEETSSILAIFANNGIKGAEAGTALKSMLTQMNTDGARKKFEELGVSMFTASGQMRPLNDVIADLKVKLDAMSAKDRTQAIQELAGSYGQLGLTSLLAAGGFGQMSKEMGNAVGLQDAASAKAGTLSGRIEGLKNQIVDLGVKAMGPINDKFIGPLVDNLSKAVTGVGEWADKNPELVTGLLGVAGAVLPAGMGLMALGGFVKMAGAAIPLLLNPIGLLIAGVGALAALLQSDFVKQGFEGWRSAVENAGKIVAHVATGGMKVANAQEMQAYDQQTNRLTYVPDAGMGGMMPGNSPWDIMEVKKPQWQMNKLESDAALGSGVANIKAVEEETTAAFDKITKKAEDTLGEKGTVIATADKGMGAFVAGFKAHTDEIAGAFGGLTPKLLTPFTNWLTTIGKLLMAIGGVPGLNLIASVGAGIMSAVQGMGQAESRDSGGRGQAGKPYMIGTGAQPEMFVPDTAGSFYPARQLAAMGGGAGGAITVQLQLDGNTIYQTVVDQDRVRNFPVWN